MILPVNGLFLFRSDLPKRLYKAMIGIFYLGDTGYQCLRRNHPCPFSNGAKDKLGKQFGI